MEACRLVRRRSGDGDRVITRVDRDCVFQREDRGCAAAVGRNVFRRRGVNVLERDLGVADVRVGFVIVMAVFMQVA